MASSVQPPRSWRAMLALVGPGVVVAATGVGAGDMVAAAKAGAAYGLPVLWVAAFGAVLKFSLAEGVARWQLATGTTVLEGWMRLGAVVRGYILVYLVVWSFIVAAALMSACGLAAHALIPALSVRAWAVIHSLAALAVVLFEGYPVVERAMKWSIGLMFVTIVGTALTRQAEPVAVLRGLVWPAVPEGGTLLLAGAVGGVGGTVTLVSYGYWLREKGWRGPDWIRGVRLDLVVGYVLTGVFGVALIYLAAVVLHPRGIEIAGSEGVLRMAAMVSPRLGRVGEVVFLAGFWAAVTTSIVGVWQGVPYLFAHLHALLEARVRGVEASQPTTSSRRYRGFLLFMAIPPMVLLLLDRPVWLVVAYAALGALFMPFLAGSLLILNNDRRRMGRLVNGWAANFVLVLSLVLFGYLAAVEAVRILSG